MFSNTLNNNNNSGIKNVLLYNTGCVVKLKSNLEFVESFGDLCQMQYFKLIKYCKVYVL